MEVILPAPVIQRRAIVSFKSLYEEWRAAYELAHPVSPVENVRFEHDPDWRTAHFLSISNARAQHHWVWKATAVLFSVGASSAAGAGMMALSPFDLAGALIALPLVVKWIKNARHRQP